MKKVWKIKEKVNIPQEVLNEAGSEILARLLVNRGIDSATKVKHFLNPLDMSIISPFAFVDMKKSVERIKKAIKDCEHITVYGDFDADGITSTSLLYKTLKELGANVGYYLPDRETEGHGLNTKALVKIIAKQKSRLIITVDCAISDVQEVKFASGFKTDVIITDHHEAPDELPPAFTILNPKAKDALIDSLSVEDLESLNNLAGVGVAFKLACALLDEYGKQDFVDEILPLVAVGTVADIVPLIGENRCFVQMGLALIRAGKHLGLDVLLKEAGIEKIDKVNSETIAFTIAPRLNASGRLCSAELAFKLLVSEDKAESLEYVTQLNELNSQRQDLCDQIYLEAVSIIEKSRTEYSTSIILFNDEWHIGIIGIVASKLIEKYGKPVFLMTKDSPESTVVRCSCRSVKGLNVYDILSVHSDLFLGFGGHSMAAGFSFDEKTISFQNFRESLNETIKEASESLELIPAVDIDLELNSSDISYELIDEIQKLEPFGAKNPVPLFALRDLKLSQFKMMGQNANHLKMFLSSSDSKVFECVKWNCPDFNLPINSKLDVAFYPKINSFNGNVTAQLDIKDIQSDNFQKNEDFIKFFDHRRKTDILDQVTDFINSSEKSIALFVENKRLEAEIKSLIGENGIIFNRQSIPSNIEQVMLFDCPSSQNLLNLIISATKATKVHLMNFEHKVINTEEFVKLVSGMFRYSDKNKKGVIDVTELAKATSTTNKSIEIALKIFKELGVIAVDGFEPGIYKISFNSSIELNKIKEHPLYCDLDNEIFGVKSFLKKLGSCEIEEVKALVLK